MCVCVCVCVCVCLFVCLCIARKGGMSQYIGGAGGSSQEKGKHLVNAYTIASRLKNVISC